ncbi:unnamed protein product, partial [Choristocarpus tenellus]
ILLPQNLPSDRPQHYWWWPGKTPSYCEPCSGILFVDWILVDRLHCCSICLCQGCFYARTTLTMMDVFFSFWGASLLYGRFKRGTCLSHTTYAICNTTYETTHEVWRAPVVLLKANQQNIGCSSCTYHL